jgi:Rrf2 family protein
MKITAQEEYGLRCLLQLANAADDASLTSAEVAHAEGLSAPYVAKLLAVLRQAGIVESERGRAGGYRLAEPAEQVGLGRVLRALGEPLFEEPSYCLQHSGSEAEGACVHRGACTLRALWMTLENWMKAVLDQLTLADLMQTESSVTDLLRSRLADAVMEPAVPLISLTSIVGQRAEPIT